jgi:ParB/RepB/Spo0J family partition protein
MPKMEKESLTQMIGLDRISDTGNIREQGKYGPDENGNFPDDIRELAESIKKSGLLEPVIVKEAGEVDGVKQYELIAGFRRRAAFQCLCAQNLNYNQIEAKIVTGDKLTIQLVENIQRSDLSAIERERAVYQMYENGIKQNEIAAQLSKSKTFVSIHISAYKMRVIADKNGIKTEGIETSTLSELLSIPDTDLPQVIKDLVNFGGTRSAARQLAAAYAEKKNPPLEMGADDPNIALDDGGEGKTEEKTWSPLDIPPDPFMGLPHDTSPEENTEVETEPPPARTPPPLDEPEPEEKPEKEKPAPAKKTESDPWPTRPEVYHAEIDVNIILTGISDYIDGIKKKLPDKGIEALTEAAKIEAANDIIALIHEKLKNA